MADAATEEGGGAPAMTAAREEISVVISLGIFLAHSRPRSHLSRPASSLRRFCCIFRRLRPSSANLRSICVRGRGSEMNHELLVTPKWTLGEDLKNIFSNPVFFFPRLTRSTSSSSYSFVFGDISSGHRKGAKSDVEAEPCDSRRRHVSRSPASISGRR